MAESLVQVTEGSGKKLHTNSRLIGANTVEDEIVSIGEQDGASYAIVTAAVSTATAASHILQIMNGGSLRLYLRRLMVYQVAAATTAAFTTWSLVQLTTAGTGGTVLGIKGMEAGVDPAAGASPMTLPTGKGTESAVLWWSGTLYFTQTISASLAGGQPSALLDLNFDQLRIKPPSLAPGTANGFALKNVPAIAGATVIVNAYVSERAYA